MRTMILAMFILVAAGCATRHHGEGSLVQRYAGSRQLEEAEEMLARGDADNAARTLTAITRGPALNGVTDRALFHLAVLSLRAESEKSGAAQAQQLLKRLAKQYPHSPYAGLARPLNELIEFAEEQKRQNRSLKKEIGELNKNLEQLKRLDLELERSAR